MNFSGKESHPNIQPSTKPGIEPETSGFGGRDLTTVPIPPLQVAQGQEIDKIQEIFNPSYNTDICIRFGVGV